MIARALQLTRRLAIAGGCALVAAPPAFAHRGQSVLSVVNWNANTSMVEVSHRMHAHDAEIGLAQSTGEANAAAVDITIVANQAKLMLYIEKHFSLADAAGVIKLDPLGAELESEVILVYQEAKLRAPPPELTIDNRILRDVFDQQTNLVNVRMAQRTRTLIFAGNDGPKQARDLL